MQLSSSKNPAKQKLGQKQSYQYWRTYDNGWTISIVCREGMTGADAGLFEMAVWNNDIPKFQTMVIVTASADFTEISNLIEEFKDDPERFYAYNNGGEEYGEAE